MNGTFSSVINREDIRLVGQQYLHYLMYYTQLAFYVKADAV